MNKKGLTLIEIIVSIALISIVMVFLFQIVITIWMQLPEALTLEQH